MCIYCLVGTVYSIKHTFTYMQTHKQYQFNINNKNKGMHDDEKRNKWQYNNQLHYSPSLFFLQALHLFLQLLNVEKE